MVVLDKLDLGCSFCTRGIMRLFVLVCVCSIAAGQVIWYDASTDNSIKEPADLIYIEYDFFE